MRVSIALATYNGEKYLREQLASFARQVRLPDELVVCDDASTDGTISVLEEFKREAPFEVRIERNSTNTGLIKNFEKALSLCTGDLIFMSDQDDVWFPEKLRVVESAFLAEPEAQMMVNDQIITDENLTPSKYTKLGQLRALGRADSSFVTGCCTALTRSWRDLCLPFPEDTDAHDRWIGGLAAACGVSRVLATPLQLYRRHDSNASQALASSSRRLGNMDLLKADRLNPGDDRWRGELGRVGRYRQRLEQARASREISNIVLAAGIAKLSRYEKAIEVRASILARRMPIRAPYVLGFFLTGGYKEFSGLRSVAADLLR